MKKIYSTLFLSIGILCVNAQTLTEANHSPVAGDMYTTYQCDSLNVNPGASGAGAVWNFSTVVTHSNVINNYTAVANSNASYPIPGVALASSVNNISYYKSTTSDLKYWGGNIVVGPVAATLIYTTAAVVAAYPMSITTSSSSATGGTINTTAPLPQAGTFVGNSGTIADGTGTLILPTGTFTNVIRVVTTQTIDFIVPLATGTVTQMNFDYYNIGTKESLFTISTSTVLTSLSPTPSTQTIVTRSVPTPVGIKENRQSLIDLVVFPNPSSNQVNFVTESKEAKQLVIYDVTGKLIEQHNFVDGKLILSVLDYNKGMYLYSILGNSNQTLKSGKITVSH
ncbi:MAG: T9SS type A sorting domain-containing protein [Bacteroidota bacterium]|nr:T9SS type A sorting domain-containing protein [Bacteroidota bacterium]MDP3144095.1 T9SS type A sorting domain-containing protein [Bacteroidota bacterium]MDP3558182.1 T9SS type A sorting domain-containing protein [Bacteroidota bacterium]